MIFCHLLFSLDTNVSGFGLKGLENTVLSDLDAAEWKSSVDLFLKKEERSIGATSRGLKLFAGVGGVDAVTSVKTWLEYFQLLVV